MITYVLNEKLNGIELYFDSKPHGEILNTLKENGWRWHNVKKCWYTKQSEKNLLIASELLNGELTRAEEPATVKEKPQAVNVQGVKVGDIFYTSWGYEQTNIDFFEVVAVTEKMATVKPIQSKKTETAFMQGHAEPIQGAYITGSGFYKEVIKTRTDKYSDTPILKNADGHDHMGYLYDGRAKSWSSYA